MSIIEMTAGRGEEMLDERRALWPANCRLGKVTDALLYRAFPCYLAPAWPTVAPDDLDRLSLGLRLVAEWIFLADRLMDDDRAPTRDLTVRVSAAQFESYRLLYGLFPTQSPFWSRFQTFASEFVDACVLEGQFQRGAREWTDLDASIAISIARGKVGMARIVAAGLAELAGVEHPYVEVSESVMRYQLAVQSVDDLRDWKEDLRKTIPSLLLQRMLRTRPDFSDGQVPPDVIASLGRQLYYDGHADHMLGEAERHLADAVALTSALPVDAWRHKIEGQRLDVVAMRTDLRRIADTSRGRRAKQKVAIPAFAPPNHPWDGMAGDATRSLVHEWRKDFGETRHLMYVRSRNGSDGARDYHAGDVFQRAVIADTLCDANEALDGALRAVVDAEADYLVEQRAQDGFGGWRYLPSALELPPDADDLAQVIQVLARSGRRALVDEHASAPLAVLFEDCRYDDGSVETWIIPRLERSDLQEWHSLILAGLPYPRSVRRHQGWSTPEVVANVVYALHLCDDGRHAAHMQSALDFLELAQEPDGSWQSLWYVGPYYGTYASVRALGALRPGSDCLRKAMVFLRGSQHADGSWGIADTPARALETSLALLAMAAISRARGLDPDDVERVTKARDYLESARGEGGLWPRASWIYMGWSNAPFGSRTITTSYVLKAALAWRTLESATRSAPSRGHRTDGPSDRRAARSGRRA
jgi:squalene-hopene/tetraprenyl-beta-curcumene cyclase